MVKSNVKFLSSGLFAIAASSLIYQTLFGWLSLISIWKEVTEQFPVSVGKSHEILTEVLFCAYTTGLARPVGAQQRVKFTVSDMTPFPLIFLACALNLIECRSAPKNLESVKFSYLISGAAS